MREAIGQYSCACIDTIEYRVAYFSGTDDARTFIKVEIKRYFSFFTANTFTLLLLGRKFRNRNVRSDENAVSIKEIDYCRFNQVTDKARQLRDTLALQARGLGSCKSCLTYA